MSCFGLLSLMLLPWAWSAEWPDIDEPLRIAGASAPADAAVVIGNEDYVSIGDVPYARSDADAFRSFLLYTRGVPIERLHVLDDASPAQMEQAVKQAASEVGAGGMLWVYYAGHGAADPETKQRVLLGAGVILDPDPVIFGEGTVALDTLKTAASQGRGDALFVVDACYSGAGRDGSALGDGRFAVPPVYRAMASVREWTATQPNQVASPLAAVRHGAFTYFAVGALRGWADGEQGEKDGEVTLSEAQAYVSTALRSVGEREQTPVVVGDMNVSLNRGRLEAGPDLRAIGEAPLPVAVAVAVADGVANSDIAALAAAAAQKRVEREAAEAAAAEAERQRQAEVAEAKRRRQEALAEAARAETEAERRYREELARRLDAAEAPMKQQAASDWAALAALRAEPSPEGVVVVETFVAKYADATVSIDDQSRAVVIAEVAAAKDWLSRQGQGDSAVGAYGYELVKVSGGAFTMGGAGGDSDEKPGHTVRVSGFWMGKTEVTQGLWERVMGSNPSRFDSCGELCPVEEVSWVDAVTFANKLSELEGLSPCYSVSGERVRWPEGLSCTGYRLPTEAEWEYAARGGEDKTYAGSNELGEVAWYWNNSDRQTHPVAQKQPNAWGLYDMSGNVWEWAWDRYGEYQSGSSVDPVGPDSGSYRVYRGGSWSNYASKARVAIRYFGDPSHRSSNLGLRLSRSIP